jgi:hypothetical protein
MMSQTWWCRRIEEVRRGGERERGSVVKGRERMCGERGSIERGRKEVQRDGERGSAKARQMRERSVMGSAVQYRARWSVQGA